MNKPVTLIQLLDELQNEAVVSTVETIKESKAVLYIDQQAADDEDGVTLTCSECILLFATPATIERFAECLDNPQDASIVLVDVTVSDIALTALEQNFAAVDED